MTTTTNQAVIEAWLKSLGPKRSKAIFFSGDTIYSYGYHYPMAKKVNGLILVNARQSTRTTERHKCLLGRATSVIRSPDFTLEGGAKEYIESILYCLTAAKRAKYKRNIRCDIAFALETYNVLQTFLREYLQSFTLSKEFKEFEERYKRLLPLAYKRLGIVEKREADKRALKALETI